MKVETYKCDVCGKQKGDVNHWWLFHAGVIERSTDQVRRLWIEPWNEIYAKLESWMHICGAECVQKKVSEFLSK